MPKNPPNKRTQPYRPSSQTPPNLPTIKASHTHYLTTMNLQTAADIPLLITSENASAERRITPSWTIAHLKTKLETVTGIPPSAQKLTLKLPDQEGVVLQAADEQSVQLARFPIQAYAEIQVRSGYLARLSIPTKPRIVGRSNHEGKKSHDMPPNQEPSSLAGICQSLPTSTNSLPYPSIIIKYETKAPLLSR